MTSVPIKKLSRARLRTKTGCITCRDRRKKCDERRPICAACERLKIYCLYRDDSEGLRTPPPAHAVVVSKPPTDRDSPELVSIPSPQATSLWLRPRGLRTQQDFNIFQYCSEKFIQHLTSPDATWEFRDVSYVFAVGFDEPWVMHAALAPAALHASYAELIPREDAILYTQSALQGLRRAARSLAAGHDSREAFLAASLFMGVFEDFYSSLSSVSLTHYQAIAKVLEVKVAGTSRLELSQMTVFERTLLDSVLYHFSTRILFEQDIDPICSSFPTETIAKYIDAIDYAGKDGSNTDSILPVLGKTPPAIFLLIYQVTWLSRQLPLDEANHSLAVDCLSELDCLEERYPVLVPSWDDDESTTLGNSDITAKLYALGLRIFLAKVLDPDNISTTSGQIESLCRQGWDLLQRFDGTAACGQLICWPVLVLGCAACPTMPLEVAPGSFDSSMLSLSAQLRKLMQELLLQIWKVSYSGYVRRTATALKQIWALPAFLMQPALGNSHDMSEIRYDGLKALISMTGLGPENFSSVLS